jgi:hypothetical protein
MIQIFKIVQAGLTELVCISITNCNAVKIYRELKGLFIYLFVVY